MHRRHPFRPLVGFVFAGLVATLAFTSAGVAKEPAAISGGDTIQATYYTPRGLSNEPISVMVQLAGDTVAEVIAKQGGKISSGERQQASRLSSEHSKTTSSPRYGASVGRCVPTTRRHTTAYESG